MHIKNYELRILGNCYDAISFGSGSQNLVLVPGLGDGMATVKGKALMGSILYSRFARKYRVTVISRKRQLIPQDDTRSMAKELAYCMEALGIAKAHVVGVSQGGMIAQHLAADRPDLIDRLVLVSTVPKANDMIVRNIDRWIGLARKGSFTGLMIDTTEKAHPEKKLKKLRPFYTYMSAPLRKMDVDRFCIMAKACATHDATDRLDQITAPTLIIGGGVDRTLGAEGSHLLHRYIGGSRLKIYPDLSHAVYEDSPDFPRTVLAFLAGEDDEEDDSRFFEA